MVAMVNDEILYTFNSKCQKSSKSHASFFILKVSIMILVSCFHNISLCKTCDPRIGPCLPNGHHLNKLSRRPLVDASYKISRL